MRGAIVRDQPAQHGGAVTFCNYTMKRLECTALAERKEESYSKNFIFGKKVI
jgi:hypothetical protein